VGPDKDDPTNDVSGLKPSHRTLYVLQQGSLCLHGFQAMAADKVNEVVQLGQVANIGANQGQCPHDQHLHRAGVSQSWQTSDYRPDVSIV
jgi:hypothetical protein